MLNEKKFRAIYEDFLTSGLTTRDYCANQQMNEAKFYYWQNKLKGQLPPKRGFVPVVFGDVHQESRLPAPVQGRKEILADPVMGDKSISCEISYPNGVRINLSGLSDPQMLQSLLLSMWRQDV
ncbi:IS66 family insertion sequence element accessory protein TnpA [Gaoshiqia sp. Z1-71]|uniref:IS66 family insertion sequence element accessory protein TnpA n=1 Tax=Gaoshiqia hydrogeniformans TaxID=3290090 RepID=UPI003BF89059